MKSCIALLLTLIASLPAHAQGITESAVSNFSNEMNEAHKKSFDQYTALIDGAFTEDSTFELHDTLTIPGQQPKQTSQSLSKPEYMNDLKNSYDTLQGAKIAYKITSIQIAPDKKSAVLKDLTSVQNKVPVPGANANKAQKMDFSSTANCVTDLVLSAQNKLQAKKTECDSQTHVILPPGMLDQ